MMPCRVVTALAALTGSLVLSFAVRADAAPRPLTRTSGLSDFAPAGEQILVTRMDEANVRVVAIPVSGGDARHVFSFDAPHGLYIQTAELAASPQRAALAVGMARVGSEDYNSVLRAFAGPVGGGWSELQPLAGLRLSSLSVQVDGERMFTLESRDEFGGGPARGGARS